MDSPQEGKDRLFEKLEALLKKQETFSREIEELRSEITQLKPTKIKPSPEKQVKKQEKPVLATDLIAEKKNITAAEIKQLGHTPAKKTTASIGTRPPKFKVDLEKFIGENLINKIGIAITVIGVAIGVKYSIDHDLVSPLTRIILGYLAAVGLLAFGMKLKKNYENFSAVLVSGSLAIMYFITYTAYDFYGLIPQVLAFVLMLVFTVFGVVAAINYNKQIIAHIGLVGAYAVPFLLSEGTGQVEILMGYMAIINIGILVISLKRYWKPLLYTSFLLTWLIYFSWYIYEYESASQLGLAWIFVCIYFVTFYLAFLAYKLLKKEKFAITDILLLLANAFIFYALGYGLITDFHSGEEFLGLFTLGNAVIHFVVSLVIYKKKLADRNLFYLVAGLVLVFITIAIPVQLDGNWVTLLWVGEAALLFWIGRTKNVPIYEKISYPLMALAFISIVHDWLVVYDGHFGFGSSDQRITPVLNINFLSSLLFAATFGFIHWLNQNKNYTSPFINQKGFLGLASFFIPAVLLVSLYYTLRLEIGAYWNQLFAYSNMTFSDENGSFPQYAGNYDLLNFKAVWLVNYSLFFFAVLSFVNILKLKRQLLGLINLAINAIAIAVFLTEGLYILSELRENYLDQSLAEYYNQGIFHLWIRYISYVFVGFILFACYRYIRQDFMKVNLKMAFDLLLHISILWITSSELLHWMDIAGSSESYKLGLSILWGVYSLFLIALGIWKKKKHLRILAIAIFAVTLIKLFFYDISHLDTIAKTVVFVSLGILLLIISFLYNKYKLIIADEVES